MKFNENTFYTCLGSPEDRVFRFMLLLLLIKFKCNNSHYTWGWTDFIRRF